VLTFPWKARTDLVIHHCRWTVNVRCCTTVFASYYTVLSLGGILLICSFISSWIHPGCRCSTLFAERLLAWLVLCGVVAVPGRPGGVLDPRAAWREDSGRLWLEHVLHSVYLHTGVPPAPKHLWSPEDQCPSSAVTIVLCSVWVQRQRKSPSS